MDNKLKCKIVEELLPNYIENSTSAEIGEFIEKHIEECEKCREKLQNMKEKANGKEIKYLNKIKLKKMSKILMVIIALVIILMLSWWVYTNYRITKDENGKYILERATINENAITNYDIMVLKGKEKNKDEIYITWYAIINAENQKCVNIIQELDGYDNKFMENEYQRLNNDWKKLRNPKLQNNKLYMSGNHLNGQERKIIKEIFENQYELISIYNI